ncbi:MAG: polysaccharide deacetylase family protein [Pseudomonadota bacterium]
MTANPDKPDLIFVLSMDTEEEWDWSGPFPEADFSVANANQLPEFQSFCDTLGIRPTYFVDYAIADSAPASATMRTIIDAGNCEVGAHLHPWANPPYFGQTGEYESHVVNLPLEQTEAKLNALLARLREAFDIVPNAFRTGRWGINGEILELLRQKGLGIDSSMYPFYRNAYFDCEATTLQPYWPDFKEPMRPGQQRDVLEFPPTVGFNGTNPSRMLRRYKAVSQPSFERLRLVGLSWHTRFVRKLYLSPEVTSGKDMRPLVDFALATKNPMLHMFLHSSSLIEQGTGLIEGPNAFGTIQRNIAELVAYAQTRANLTFCTLSEAALLVNHRVGMAA